MTQSNGPLTGLKVVEFVGIGPGPHATMLLADMGAEIVRIERHGSSTMNPVVERARHRVAVDIRSDEGREFCIQAASKADVLIEGFRPGVMERLGLGPEVLCEQNDRLVYARMTGWGQEGPLAKAAGHDINYIAITGALDAVGKPGETATPPQNLVGDFGGGSMYCAFGILAALYERERSGKGQVIDAAIVDGATSLMSFFFGVRHLPHFSTDRGKGILGGAAHFIAVMNALMDARFRLVRLNRNSMLNCWKNRALLQNWRKINRTQVILVTMPTNWLHYSKPRQPRNGLRCWREAMLASHQFSRSTRRVSTRI